ncbi:MAG: GNAT family N-acetyltransferase [Deltaproteobacteria bacterium]|nr:GNAT family N-acetyltransferase [Deltaproteobacteria bacterium]
MKTFIRVMQKKDVDVAIAWAAAEGWQPGVNDAQCFYDADSHDFFIAEENGKPVGTVSAVSYEEDFGFIELFIVVPKKRDRRIGVDLGQQALSYLHKQNVGVDGVLAKVKNYESAGFKPSYSNARFEGLFATQKAINPLIVSAHRISFEQLLDYDSAHFPAKREVFLRNWLEQPEAQSLVIIDGSKILGFGLIRPCIGCYKVEPLFAGNEENCSRAAKCVDFSNPGRRKILSGYS